MTKLCDTCEYLRYCARSGIEDVGCDRYKKDMTTNEEYLKSCNTEQLADVLNKMTLSCYICGQDGVREDTRHCVFGKCTGKEDILVWLKQPHT